MQNLKVLSFLFLPIYGFSFFLVFSSSHLFIIWLGMELNLVAFLGILKLTSKNSLELNSMKYFLSQALGSLLLMFSLSINMMTASMEYIYLFILFSIILKLGLFPLHEWFISFSMTSKASEFWLVSIPQKIIPVWLLMNLSVSKMMVIMSVIMGVLISIMASLSTNRMLVILAYSSVMNTSWLVLLANNLDMFFLVYFVYGLSLFMVLLAMSELDFFLSSVVSQDSSWVSQTMLIISFLNLAGMPPFLNMWGKGMLMYSLLTMGQLFYLGVFLLSSVSFLYIYLRTCFCLFSFSSKTLSFTGILSKKNTFMWLSLSSYLIFLI